MAITRDQALTLGTFHRPGSREADKNRCYVLRRNGRTKTWVRRPEAYQIPVKYGMYEYGYIMSADLACPGDVSGDGVFTREDCPCCGGAKS